jgi:hypothetical protein
VFEVVRLAGLGGLPGIAESAAEAKSGTRSRVSAEPLI